VNSLYPKLVPLRGVGIVFIMRDLLTSQSISDVLFRLEAIKEKISNGFNLNFGDIGKQELYTIEIAPQNYNMVRIKSSALPHFNMYLRMKIEQEDGPSSEARLARFKEFVQVTSEQQVREFLGDTKNQEYPVYRADAISTLATGYFDMIAKTLDVYISNPKTGTKVHTFTIPYTNQQHSSADQQDPT
jgi:hypothetical protein